MTKCEARWFFLQCAGKLLTYAATLEDCRFICTCFYRTQEEQTKHREAGTSRVIRSKHQDWLAMDLAQLNDRDMPIWTDTPQYQALGKFWKNLNSLCEWGGDYQEIHDIYHFSFTNEWRKL